MKNLLAIILTAAILILVSCKETPPEPPPIPDTGINYEFYMESPINTAMSQNRIPGLVISVMKDGEIDWEKGYGKADIEANVAASNNTRFMINETADVIVAAAVYQAESLGLVDLDANINRYLGWKFSHPTFPQAIISLRMLLAHTAGVVDNDGLIAGTYGPGDSQMNLGLFLENYLVEGGANYAVTNYSDQRPGKIYSYSRIGIALAAHIVEIVSEIDFDVFCKTHLFAQLGLQNVSWFLRDIQPSKLATPYTLDGSSLNPEANYGFVIYPSGQLRISSNHLSRFLLAMIQKGDYGSQEVLEPKTVADINSVQYPLADAGQALGWKYENIKGKDLLGMSGSDIGFSSRMYMNPATGVGVIILTNGSGYDEILDELLILAFETAENN